MKTRGCFKRKALGSVDQEALVGGCVSDFISRRFERGQRSNCGLATAEEGRSLRKSVLELWLRYLRCCSKIFGLITLRLHANQG